MCPPARVCFLRFTHFPGADFSEKNNTPDLAEPVRGRPDAGARGGTQRKQHLDEDPPRAPLRRAPELPQQHRRPADLIDSRFFLNMTRIA